MKATLSYNLRVAFIYALSLPGEGARYVGQTIRTAYQKQRDYRAHQRRGVSNPNRPVEHWLVKHAATPVNLVVLEECDKSDLDSREKFWIAEYKRLGFELLNVLPGGQSNPQAGKRKDKKILSAEHRAKIGKTLTGQKRAPRGRAGQATDAEREARVKQAHRRWHLNRGIKKDGCAYC